MESVFYGFENENIMNIEFMCGLLANYSKELSEAETYREKGDVQLKHAKLILDKVKNCSIPVVVGQSEQLVCTCSRAKGLDHDEEGTPYCISCQKEVQF